MRIPNSKQCVRKPQDIFFGSPLHPTRRVRTRSIVSGMDRSRFGWETLFHAHPQGGFNQYRGCTQSSIALFRAEIELNTTVKGFSEMRCDHNLDWTISGLENMSPPLQLRGSLFTARYLRALAQFVALDSVETC